MIPDDTWGNLPVPISMPGDRDELLALRRQLEDETREIAAKPKWWRRHHLSKAQRWGFEYRLVVMARIDQTLQHDQETSGTKTLLDPY